MPAQRLEEQGTTQTTTSAPAAGSGDKAAPLPRPTIEVTPLKNALPADGGTMELLVTTAVAFPQISVDRKPLNLALVVDRSGSMSGAPLEAAKEAARTAVAMLMPGDWVAVIAFDDQVQTLVPLVKVDGDRSSILHAISAIRAGGSTDLYGGWAEGLSQVMACPDRDAQSRVVLLSDGMANHGVTDHPTISHDVAQAVKHGVTTTSMGLGRGYDEALLRAVADAGQGNYVFIEDSGALVPAFERELAGMSALRGRNVRLAPVEGGGLSLRPWQLPTTGGAAQAASGALALPDLVAGMPTEHLVWADLEAGASAIELTLSWDDAVTGHPDSQRVRLALPIATRGEFDALAANPLVVGHQMALEVAQVKARISNVARAGNIPEARRLLEGAQALVARLPAGETRSQEEQELEVLADSLARLDLAMAARQAEKFSRDRYRGQSDMKRQAMLKLEAELRHEKLAAMSPAPAPVRPAAAAGNLLLERKVPSAGGVDATLQVVLGDITDQHVDAIVSTTNRGLFATEGVAGAIGRRGGPELAAALRDLAPIDFGGAVFTPGFRLPAKYVIHTATPPWGATGRELHYLAHCYGSVFEFAERLGARSLALPSIGTGTYQYPPAEAALVAVKALHGWLRSRGNLDLVRFVVFENATAQAYLGVLGSF